MSSALQCPAALLCTCIFTSQPKKRKKNPNNKRSRLLPSLSENVCVYLQIIKLYCSFPGQISWHFYMHLLSASIPLQCVLSIIKTKLHTLAVSEQSMSINHQEDKNLQNQVIVILSCFLVVQLTLFSDLKYSHC